MQAGLSRHHRKGHLMPEGSWLQFSYQNDHPPLKWSDSQVKCLWTGELSDCTLGFSFLPKSTFILPLSPSFPGGGQGGRSLHLFSCLNRLQRLRGMSVPSTVQTCKSMSPCHFNPNLLVCRPRVYAAFCIHVPSCQGRTHQSKFFFNLLKLEHKSVDARESFLYS